MQRTAHQDQTVVNCEFCCLIGDFELQVGSLGVGNKGSAPKSKIMHLSWKHGWGARVRWRAPVSLRDSMAVVELDHDAMEDPEVVKIAVTLDMGEGVGQGCSNDSKIRIELLRLNVE